MLHRTETAGLNLGTGAVCPIATECHNHRGTACKRVPVMSRRCNTSTSVTAHAVRRACAGDNSSSRTQSTRREVHPKVSTDLEVDEVVAEGSDVASRRPDAGRRSQPSELLVHSHHLRVRTVIAALASL